MRDAIETLSALLWGVPTMALLLLVGLTTTILTKAMQA